MSNTNGISHLKYHQIYFPLLDSCYTRKVTSFWTAALSILGDGSVCQSVHFVLDQLEHLHKSSMRAWMTDSSLLTRIVYLLVVVLVVRSYRSQPTTIHTTGRQATAYCKLHMRDAFSPFTQRGSSFSWCARVEYSLKAQRAQRKERQIYSHANTIMIF